MRHGQFWARNPGGVGACSQPGGWAALRRVLNAESVGRLGNERKLGGSSGGGRMLRTARLSLPGPEYLGEERWGGEGRAAQRSSPKAPCPESAAGRRWEGSAGPGVVAAWPGLPGGRGERPAARDVFPLAGSRQAESGQSDSVSAFSAPGGCRSVL